jgi:DNA-binding MarR family transcriptional regulator
MDRTTLTNRELFFMLQKSLCFFDKVADQVIRKEADLTLAQFHVLMMIFMHGTTSQQLVAQMLQNTQASVSRQVSLLLRKKCLTRTQNPKNKREYHLANTSLGTTLVKKAVKALDQKFKEVFSVVPEKDKEKMVQNLNKIIHKEGAKHAHLHCDLADSENMDACVRENLKRL